MREVIAVCRSTRKSRERTAEILDRYFWRIGGRTWRGKATNACLDRVARELRQAATRNTAVTIHEIRSAHESRTPLIRIGSKLAFSDEGLVPVASHPAAVRRGSDGPVSEVCAAAAVRIAVLFHDLGKATSLFQNKLRLVINEKKPEPDAIRHELHSAVVWDILFGRTHDSDLQTALRSLAPECVDEACRNAIEKLAAIHRDPKAPLGLNFLRESGSLSHLIGLLVLTHHRLPDGDSDHLTMVGREHVNAGALDRDKLRIHPGVPFWHEEWWLTRLRRDAALLSAGAHISGADIALRASLMFADHLGSAEKTVSDTPPDHLANTVANEGKKLVAADSLSRHVHRVYSRARGAFDLLHRYRDRFPALSQGHVPTDMMFPGPSDDPRFRWQAEAAGAARAMCEANEGGFFGCLLSGTGTGKTRGAPTILANAAFGDARPERRYLRFSLALGLRVLATQSARDYVDDLGFRDEDVSVLVGQAPLDFNGPPEDATGSESLIDLPDWLRIERVNGAIPAEGDAREADWLRSLSIDTDRGLPAYCDLIFSAAGERAHVGRRLIAPPIMVGTIDHLMGIASPVNSRFLVQTIRLLTSDLILDEIDQFDGEDIAAIGRLVYQAGAAGRRVIIMSATLTGDIAEALHSAYCRGWEGFAKARGLSENVNLLCTGDAPGSCFTNEGGRDLKQVMADCSHAILRSIESSPILRRGEVLPPCDIWNDMLAQIDAGCSRMHAAHAAKIDGFGVSIGLVRMTRISHTAALAAQLPSGDVRGRLRVTLCLHSQFPRLHREWIESRLRRALTRKQPHPDKGLRDLCIERDVFARAEKVGAREIEIVVIASPVIETGNDLDFDYAILDPSSMRSIVQSAGRVRRHRPALEGPPNVLVLGRSPIVMQDGKLARPGVETKPAPETCVAARSLQQFEGRRLVDLAADERFERISAAVLLSGAGVVPLRDEERALREAMVSADNSAPLGKYIRNLDARMNLKMTKTRRFRRSETRDILYRMEGDSLEDAQWFVDFAPGGRESDPRPAAKHGLTVGAVSGEHLFTELTRSGWMALGHGASDMGRQSLRNLLEARVPDYNDDLKRPLLEPPFAYTDFTGFTRGSLEDLCSPFGKKPKDQ